MEQPIFIDAFGLDGWELISVIPATNPEGTETLRYFFKKKIES